MRTIRFDFGRLDFADVFVVVTFKAGTDVGPSHFERITAAIQDHFGERPYGYISHRIHRYSVHPLAAGHLIESTNVVAGALVVQSEVAREIAEAEKFFYNRPVRVFTSLEEAKAWLRPQLPAPSTVDLDAEDHA